ncbi:unnamed protein product [Parnassius apollo]|uniref:(apollo) hypothetical protein n=1 Tax=Parnassius apollo TaxID=110799 RepID=A0A8S3X1J4_PARAO|nr:unnamed protein product [Parnassius apollo]
MPKINCKGCKRVIYTKCSGLSATELRVVALQTPKLSYLCDDCEEGLRQIPDLRRLVTELQQQVQELRKNHINVVNLDTVINEIQERKNRSRNLIVFGIPESTANSPEERKSHDKDQVSKTITSLATPEPEILTVIRLGKPVSKIEKPRPIKVVLANKHNAINVLKNKGKLPNSVKVKADMTPYQRDQLRRLRGELAARTEKGEQNLTIKYINNIPKIITTTKKLARHNITELRILYTNLASIMAKFDLFLLEVNTHKPAFILISETHLHSGIDDSLININGYTLFRLDRRERKGGGVAMYVAHDVNNVPVISKVNKIYYNSLVEALWLDIHYGYLDLLLACVYRPPSNVLTSADEILLNTIEKVASKQTVIIAGVFNLPNIKWPLDNLTGHNKLCESFVAMYSNSNLNQLVTHITRKRNNAESLLDLILCNDETLITDIKYLPPIGKSDHLVILASMQIINNDSKVPIIKIFDFYKADYNKINKDLAENFNIIGNQVDKMWLSFKNQIHTSLENCVKKITENK